MGKRHTIGGMTRPTITIIEALQVGDEMVSEQLRDMT